MVERLPPHARELLEGEDLGVSSMVCLELGYLHEIGRLSEPSGAVVDALGRTLGLRVLDSPFATIAREATRLSWTRDPFDRLICAHAVVDDLPLLTADRTIHANLPEAVWDG